MLPHAHAGRGALLVYQMLGLLELEVGEVARAVYQLYDQLPAGVRPRFVRLPHIVVLVVTRTERQRARAGVVCRLRRAKWGACVAVDRYGLRVARCKDVQSLVAAEAELQRNRLAGLSRVPGRRIVDRREEAGPVVDDDVRGGFRAYATSLSVTATVTGYEPVVV